jgi:hypothetical protein
MGLTRVTLTLYWQLMEEASHLSNGNFSRLVSNLLKERLDELRRQRLRAELQAGYEVEAAHDLEIAGEYRYLDDEMAQCEEVCSEAVT